MQYREQIVIEKPLQDVVRHFTNPDTYAEWMKGFIKMEPLSGEPGTPGAKTNFVFKMGNREMTMLETILENNLPHSFKVSFEARGVFNIVVSRFEAQSATSTLYINDQDFKFSGFMKIIGWLMPGAFKKQSRKFLEDFKAFVEKQP
ncbi:MAG TPA: SRPBCC family protein [Ferruginibacter sp.]|nr:SRPBCC family protein [Chitinophagaceae bacterium]HML57478.1 SRPBCC family protein [Ferruginibacter sp.]HRN92432.1 SRPBCC family protein [Ferruginibacter sp.]HRO06610.1 SRPBCC family protein [Ferruginibacter sp.]HRO96868.1 SRPBCC family protein [Ferruginibacter sp.]